MNTYHALWRADWIVSGFGAWMHSFARTTGGTDAHRPYRAGRVKGGR